MKILFLTNIPSPYRVKFFNKLGEYCDLTVLFEKNTSTERDESWKNYSFEYFTGIFLRGLTVKTDSSLCLSVKKYLKNEKYEAVICSNFTSPTGMYAVHYMKKHHIPFILESDGGFPKTGRGIKEMLKRSTISGADYYLSTSEMHDKYYLQYGAKNDRIVRYPFSSVSEKDILASPVTIEEKKVLKKKLNIREERIVLAVGQFIQRKGFDILIKSSKSVSENTGIYIIGGEPEHEYKSLLEKTECKNIYFIGFKKPTELSDYYRAADIFVLPTREDIWGLVINEAMSFGLPVITTERCLAGVEMIENDKNGLIVPVDDPEKLSIAMNGLLTDSARMEFMSLNNLEKTHKYTIESMVKSHLDLFGNLSTGRAS